MKEEKLGEYLTWVEVDTTHFLSLLIIFSIYLKKKEQQLESLSRLFYNIHSIYAFQNLTLVQWR